MGLTNSSDPERFPTLPLPFGRVLVWFLDIPVTLLNHGVFFCSAPGQPNMLSVSLYYPLPTAVGSIEVSVLPVTVSPSLLLFSLGSLFCFSEAVQ